MNRGYSMGGVGVMRRLGAVSGRHKEAVVEVAGKVQCKVNINEASAAKLQQFFSRRGGRFFRRGCQQTG
jgi:hypothetical protein